MLMSLVSLLIAYISTKTKLGVIIQTVMTLALLLGVMLLQFGINLNDSNPLGNQVNLMILIKSYYVPLNWFYEAVVNQSILDLILLLVSNIVIFILSIHFFENLSLKINKSTVKRKKL